jgi:hypothetical protein
MDFGITIKPDILVAQPFLAVLLRLHPQIQSADQGRTTS